MAKRLSRPTKKSGTRKTKKSTKRGQTAYNMFVKSEQPQQHGIVGKEKGSKRAKSTKKHASKSVKRLVSTKKQASKSRKAFQSAKRSTTVKKQNSGIRQASNWDIPTTGSKLGMHSKTNKKQANEQLHQSASRTSQKSASK
ncbi:unnamed protein product [Didymodactylos carnosus]|uniref:Uncharacterized protein n=1 Tax=Didymodactylos carnosus TaxID=1234261 RepID=A0A815X1P0_9BILA|nr:unnamed protein product [Didymodactylos carnosus]CAF1551935.1 unnamed protein product [Didymodactylos carnosus]CAF4087188.1 unnamed protein product [Didymodactylos carnosus]CAF4412980.1 unnamed protein product [Didymodactylos carnosus]